MNLAKLRSLLVLVAGLSVAVPLGGCDAPQSTRATAQAIDGIEFDRFPTPEAVDSAITNFQRDPTAARARDAIPLNEFFGERVNGAFSSDFKVELIRPDPGISGEPVAALHVKFAAQQDPLNINNRYKDVHLFKLADSLGVPFNPFPEAAPIPGETGIVMRLWTDFQKMAKGVPADMAADQVLPELARITIWSYVDGNTDGVNNGGNAGFAKFRDASGREFWHAVLVDGGGSFNTPGQYLAPWTINLAGRGTVQAANIPQDVVISLQQIARGSDADLVQWAALDPAGDARLAQAMTGMRARAQEVLNHYGIAWQ
jgi:hypothetical protein